jgi:hypothetical protein
MTIVWLTGLQAYPLTAEPAVTAESTVTTEPAVTAESTVTTEPAVTAESTVTAEPVVTAEPCSSYLKKLTLKRRLNSFQAIHLQRQFDSTFLEYSPH